MTKEITLNELGEMLEHVVKHMATKDQLFDLQNQVNSIEGQLRNANHGKLEVRVADLEEEVFGKNRS